MPEGMLGGLIHYQLAAADAFQRPLRSRFQARLRRSVRRPPVVKGVAVLLALLG